jgi:DNA helicase II / ATP-dependent DNA helicase PcrA
LAKLQLPLWEILSDETSATTMSGRAAKSVNQFVEMIKTAQAQLEANTAAEILNYIIEESGYIDDLKQQGTDEADNRIENLFELYNAIVQFQEDNEETSLEAFLSSAALASDLDNLDETQTKVSLMTLHSAKGLEFPIVFLVGVEQGLLPHSRTINDPLEMEEERRLCYVGITRAQEQLFLTYTRERRLWGYREPAVASQFLKEIPEELISSNIAQATNYLRRRETEETTDTNNHKANWQIGDRVFHKDFGEGEITHVLNGGTKPTLAVKFDSLKRTKILSQSASIELLNG